MDKREEKIYVKCTYKKSSKCMKTHKISIRALQLNLSRNKKYICLYCSRKTKFSGRNNPNCKYKMLNDNYMSIIDTEEKAYILGLIASDGNIGKNGTTSLFLHKKDIDIIQQISNILNIKIQNYKSHKKMYGININSKQISSDICKHLNIKPMKKSDIVNFPNITKELERHFIRGYFDGDGSIIHPIGKKSYPICKIASNSIHMLKSISESTNIKFGIGKDYLEYYGNNALDFMGYIYDNSSIKLNRKYDLYLQWSMWIPALFGHYGKHDKFTYSKTRNDAIFPSKTRPSDSGYDLTILEKIKDMGDVELYDTGIKIKPSYGWYFEVIPRSSISKTGYMLANSIGIIDRTYTGPILIALRKIDKSAKDIELPCKIAQLIPRPIIHVEMIEGNVDETDRGPRGFGSTGK